MICGLRKCHLLLVILIFIQMFIHETECRLKQTWLINTTPPPNLNHNYVGSMLDKQNTTIPEILYPPKIDQIDITSNIQFRYSKTVVKAVIKNPSMSKAQEVKFRMRLPISAFISNFTIQEKGENKIYVAKVAKKEEAKSIYNEAVSRGQSGGLVDTDSRHVSQITISSNIKAASKMEFTLTYEELLKRHISRYEHIIHINPGEIVEDYKVKIYINESLPITFINVPELKRSENEITSLLDDNEIANITRNIENDPRKAHIEFSPSVEDQKRMAKTKDNSPGMSGQFIVQYDVDRKNQGSDVQVMDGYFVHFFSPDFLEPLPKHVIFVLDISGSMYGTKLVQLKDAMITILDDLSDKDFFNILTFSTRVQQWEPNLPKEKSGNQDFVLNGATPGAEKGSLITHQGTKSVLRQARKYILNLRDGGGTNINDALVTAIDVAKKVRVSEEIPANTKPMIIFLTDGEATQGITDSKQIRSNVMDSNENYDIPIYGLAFGTGADFQLIKSIGTESGAFSRKIYEASDAAIQLEDFFAEISSPLLNNVSFDYVGEAFKNKSGSNLKTFFKGGEYIVAGKLEMSEAGNEILKEEIEIIVLAEGNSSKYKEKIKPCEPIPMPRLFPVSLLPDYDLSEEDADNSSTIVNDTETVDAMFIHRPPCIPWPMPPHTPPTNSTPKTLKSESENFLERLWAYLTIENLLDEKVSKAEKDKMIIQGQNITDESLANQTKLDEGKALKLALEYNFVTKLTSLVVVQPEDIKTQKDLMSNTTVVNPVPVGMMTRVPRPYHVNRMRAFGTNYARSGGVRARGPSTLYYNRGPRGPIRAPISRMGHSRRRKTMASKTMVGQSMAGLPGPPGPSFSHTFLSKTIDSSPKITSGFFTTTSHPVLRSPEPTTIVAQHKFKQSLYSSTIVKEDCEISLFSKTYLRGSTITINNNLNSSVPDLSIYSFDDKLKSLEVKGPCCWEIFEDKHFMGHRKRFSTGTYKSSTMLGADLVREASSLRITLC